MIPIVLLSIMRKILVIILIDRTWNRMKGAIPNSQAAHQQRRSNTEQVFTLKVMIEKAISTDNYNIWIALLDMSKAFDSVSRNKLSESLEEILTSWELGIMHILIHGTVLNVWLGKATGGDKLTKTEITQGDCLSALLFIFYPAKTIKQLPDQTEEQDSRHRIFWSALR